jgi:hypothetical protein
MPGGGDSKKLTVVRLQGSTAAGMRGADAMLQHQLGKLLQGLYDVHVYTHEDAMHQQQGKGSNSSKPDSIQTPTAHKLWLGAVDYDASSSGPPDAVQLTRNPIKGQQSSPVLLFEDKLTVISKAGPHQVRQMCGWWAEIMLCLWTMHTCLSADSQLSLQGQTPLKQHDQMGMAVMRLCCVHKTGGQCLCCLAKMSM